MVVWCGDDDEHGKRPGLLSAAVRSSSWDMRAILRNRVGDRRAQAIFVQQQGDGCIYLSDLPSQNKATRTYKRKEGRSSSVYGECKCEARSYQQIDNPRSACEVDEGMKPGDCLEPRALRIRRWQAIRDDDIDAMPLSPRHPNPSAATSSANQPTVWRAIFELIASEKVSLYSQSMIK